MSSGRRNIDYGPIALPVGELPEVKALAPNCEQLQADSARLQDILSRLKMPSRTHGQPEGAVTPDHESDRDQLGELNAFELGQELERLWVCNGAGGRREVRIRLAPALIPGTWVRILSHGGVLQVELSVASDGTRHWLDSAADKLAEDLATRLRCAVRVIITDATGAESACVAFEWKGERRS
jgi:hypothetical protein